MRPSSFWICLCLVSSPTIVHAQVAPSAAPSPAPSAVTPPPSGTAIAPEPAPALPPPIESPPPVASVPPPAAVSGVVELRTPIPEPHQPRAGAHVHDGFYLRLGTGFGIYDEKLTSERSDLYSGRVRGRTTGLASLGEFALGGTIARGLVLGGGVYSADLATATFRVDANSDDVPPRELDPEVRNLTLVGPFLDWYPNTTRGLHWQAALAFASLNTRIDAAQSDDRDYDAFGGGLVLGLGYEWWVGDEWSLGVLARATGAVLSGKDEQDVRWVHAVVTSPALLLTLTYH